MHWPIPIGSALAALMQHRSYRTACPVNDRAMAETALSSRGGDGLHSLLWCPITNFRIAVRRVNSLAGEAALRGD